MSLALYRKYRPATFAEVVGQEHVTGPLSQALTNGRLSHAYLFSGPRGCGKTSSARILARSLNCAQGPTPTPCGVCESCVALAPGGPGSLDVIEIDAASHNGVDDARDLRERAAFSPASSRFKVYVIDEAHMVTKSAFNALLKLVEEPPPFVKFVFATTEPEEVLQTIRSRTHHYPFRLLPPGVLRELLEDICAKEGVAVEPAVLPLVVAAGAGSARDALSVLDQLLAGAGERGVTYADALPLLGVTDAALLDDTIDALAAGDAAAVFETVDRVVEAGHDPRRFAADLLQRLRDLIIIGAVPEAAAKGLIAAPEDQLATMTGQAGRLGPAALSRMADVVHGSLDTMRGTTSPRLLLELVCARMLLPAATGDAAAMLQRLERLERRLDIATPARATAEPATAAGSAVRRSPAAAPDRTTSPPPTERRAAARPERQAAAPPDASVPASSADSVPVGSADSAAQDSEHTAPGRSGDGAAEPGGIDTAAVRRAWPNILAAVGKQRRVVAAYLLDANVTAIQGSTLVLGFPHPFHAKALSEPPAIDYFTDALTEVLGVRWTVRCEVTDGSQLPLRGEPAGPTTPQPVTSIPGFAPGDAPTDEESADAADRSTQTTEEQAISLLAQNLGARKIGEVENG